MAAADLLVTKRTAAGVESTLTLTTHYTVTGAGEATGNVTLITALASGETLTIRRAVRMFSGWPDHDHTT